MLERSLRLAEENNTILIKMRRGARLSQAMSYVYWLIIIGISVGAYYYAKPYLDKAINLYNSAQTNINGVGKILDSLK